MIIGLGSGSTVYWTIKRIGELVSEGLRVTGIPTSIRTEKLAKECGIQLIGFKDVRNIDITIDGADEVDPNLIKSLHLLNPIFCSKQYGGSCTHSYDRAHGFFRFYIQ